MRAKAAHEKGERVILVRLGDISGRYRRYACTEGILTVRGGMTSHAAVVARGMGTSAYPDAGEIKINEEAKTFELGGHTFARGRLHLLRWFHR